MLIFLFFAGSRSSLIAQKPSVLFNLALLLTLPSASCVAGFATVLGRDTFPVLATFLLWPFNTSELGWFARPDECCGVLGLKMSLDHYYLQFEKEVWPGVVSFGAMHLPHLAIVAALWKGHRVSKGLFQVQVEPKNFLCCCLQIESVMSE